MPILKIARMGHPALTRRAEPVEDPGDPEVERLVEDMILTLEDAGGIGLAAPQVHDSRRVIIFRPDPENPRNREVTVLINPEIEPLEDGPEFGWEGCLSIPQLRGLVPRHTRIRYRGVGLDGRLVEAEAHGLHARVVQHEVDHLNGILYPMRMSDLRFLTFESELRHFAREPEES